MADNYTIEPLHQLRRMRGIPDSEFITDLKRGYVRSPMYDRLLDSTRNNAFDFKTFYMLQTAVDNYMYRIVVFLRLWLGRTRIRLSQLEEFRTPSVLASIRSRELVGTKRKRV